MKKLSFQVKSRLYLGLIGVKWSQYATYFHLGPIQGLYKEDMLVIYHDFEGNLPFTGILREVYGLPYSRSTTISYDIRVDGKNEVLGDDFSEEYHNTGYHSKFGQGLRNIKYVIT